MHNFVSALVGGLAAGAVGLLATSSTRQPAVDVERTFAEPAMRATPVAYSVQQAPTPGPTTVVRCGPADAPVAVRSTGAAPVEVECAPAAAIAPAAFATYAPMAPAGLVAAPATVTMLASEPRVRTVAYDDPPVRRTVVRERPAGRSKAKTALVIGGSGAAGAGIGGLAGGKKGALIGAALGGGGAAIFEALKRQ